MIFFFHWMALRIVCVVTCTFLTFFPALHEPTPNGVRVIHKIDGMCDRPVPWRSQARKKDKKNSDPYRIKESFRFALSLSVCLSILARSFLVQTPRMLVSGEQLHFVFFFISSFTVHRIVFNALFAYKIQKFVENVFGLSSLHSGCCCCWCVKDAIWIRWGRFHYYYVKACAMRARNSIFGHFSGSYCSKDCFLFYFYIFLILYPIFHVIVIFGRTYFFLIL